MLRKHRTIEYEKNYRLPVQELYSTHIQYGKKFEVVETFERCHLGYAKLFLVWQGKCGNCRKTFSFNTGQEPWNTQFPYRCPACRDILARKRKKRKKQKNPPVAIEPSYSPFASDYEDDED